MKKALFVLIPILAVFSFCCEPDDPRNKSNMVITKDTVEFPENDDLYEPEEDVVVEEDTTVNENIMVENEDGDLELKDENTVIENANFYVVAASYKNLKSAEKINADYQSKGYNSIILPKVGKLNRIAIASFDDETSARAGLKKLRTELNNKTFWLLYK